MFQHEQLADSIEQAQKQSRTRYFWWITYLADLSDWDFLWEPVPWQAHQRHAWASQWQKDSGVYLIPRDWNGQHTNYHNLPVVNRVHKETDCWQVPGGIDIKSFDWTWHPDPTDPPYIYQFGTQHQRTGGPQYCMKGAINIKFVDQIRVQTNRVATAIYEIDHMDGNAGNIADTTRRVRYFDNYRDTLIRLARSIGSEHEFVWICSSICNYTDFDFSWHPEQWQATMLHVFASEGEKFGDTFFMHVPSFAARAERVELLEWYDCNFVDASVPRRPIPVIEHNYDSQAEAVRSLPFDGPLALYTTTDYVPGNLTTVTLWRQETKTITPLSTGASSVIVPREAVPSIKTQLYDYPYIDKTRRLLKDEPLDIVFISNGEKDAVANYAWLDTVTRHANNRIHWSDGVTGRVAAYHAAAEMSTTPWFFAVFAKLRVNQHFDWSWQPDRMQAAKHYIFHARNTINDLEYGHQGMIAYNKRLVLENTGTGLDFTLDQPHEVVPILSGEAIYYTSNWVAWRTAFREALKLRASLPDVENEYRLNAWLKVDYGAGQWSSKGAQDAVEYYEEVGGDFDALKKSYEWSWLATYALLKRNLTTDP